MPEDMRKISKSEQERSGSTSHWKRGKFRKQAEEREASDEKFRKANPVRRKLGSKESRIRLHQVAAKERYIEKRSGKKNTTRKRVSTK